ncbi:MAG TPA: hypothetical protein EYN79_05410 [Planctomycetes bacterium]|nr:hypothetical protein [Planctomycetota bacterium]
MAEEQEHVTIAQKIRQIPLILRVCAGILAFLFILILLVFQLSSAIRTSSERELASLKEAIGVSSARELFNNYAKERVEKGGGPGLPPDALASFDFAVFEEDISSTEEEQRHEVSVAQEQVVDSLARFLTETASEEPFLHKEEISFWTEITPFALTRTAVKAFAASSNRALEDGRLEAATSRIIDAIELLERVSDQPIVLSQMIRLATLELALDAIEKGFGDFEEEQLVRLRDRLDSIELDRDFEGMVRGEVLMTADILFGESVEVQHAPIPVAYTGAFSIDLREFSIRMFPVARAPLEVDWENWEASLAEIPWWAPMSRMIVVNWRGIHRKYQEMKLRLQLLDEALRCLIAVARGEEAGAGNGYRLFKDEMGTWLEAIEGETIIAPLLIEKVTPPPPQVVGSTGRSDDSGELDG